MAKLTPLEQDTAVPARRPTPPATAAAQPASLSFDRPIQSLHILLTSQKHFSTLATILLINEALLCLAIIHYVPCKPRSWGMCAGESRRVEREGADGVQGGRAVCWDGSCFDRAWECEASFSSAWRAAGGAKEGVELLRWLVEFSLARTAGRLRSEPLPVRWKMQETVAVFWD